MPRRRRQQPLQVDPREERLSELGALTDGEDVDPLSLVKMLSELYGIQQAQETTPVELEHLRSQIGTNQAQQQLYETEAREYGPAHQKMSMLNEAESLSYMFGGPENIPEGLRKEMLKRHGFNVDELTPAPPPGAMTAPTTTPTAQQKPQASIPWWQYALMGP